MEASEFSLLQERVCHVVPTAGAVTFGKPIRHAATSHWRTTRLEVEVGVTFRTVVISLFRLQVLYLELFCPLFIRRLLPLRPSVFTDKILLNASPLPFFATNGTISMASLCGIFGGRYNCGICFCGSITVFPCQYGSNSAPFAWFFFICRWQILTIYSITEKQLLSPDRSTSCRSQRLHIGSHMHFIFVYFLMWSIMLYSLIQSVLIFNAVFVLYI